MVKDFKFNDLRKEFRPVAFMPPARYARFLEVRTLGDPISVATAVRQALRQVDPNLPVTAIKTLTRQVDESLIRERLIAGLSSFFAMLALLLACIGLFGVLAYAVTRRTREIGVRMAVGARQQDIMAMVLREALLLALAGLGIGLVSSVVLAGAVSSQLYGLKATDPHTMICASLLLLVAAALAGFMPAHKASQVDPMTSLRVE